MIKVKLGADKEIWGYTDTERESIMNDLTLLNPAYTNAMRYSPFASTRISKYLEYYAESCGIMSVPRGYKLKFPYKIVEDERFENTIEYPDFCLNLREAQHEAVKKYINYVTFNKETQDGFIVLSTGIGKSLVGIFIAAYLKQKTLIIVQKDDLISGWRNDIIQALRLLPKQIGLIKAKEFRIGKQITLCTIQTLSRLSPEKLKIMKKEFSMIIQDEMQFVGAKSYEVINTFPAKYRLGLTATDMRNDGLDLVMKFYLGEPIYRCYESEDIITPDHVTIKIKDIPMSYTPKKAYMNKYGKEVFAIKIGDKLTNIRDLKPSDIEELINDKVIREKPTDFHKVIDAVQNNKEFKIILIDDVYGEAINNKSCVVMFLEKDICEQFAEMLVERGLSKEKIQLFYGDSKVSDDTIKRRAETKEVLVTIATFAKATFGTNVKAWERVFFGFSVGNEKDLIQAIGRGRRTCKGKSDLVVYDYRYKNVATLDKHGYRRNRVYNKYGFKMIYSHPKSSSPKKLFKRGFSAIV